MSGAHARQAYDLAVLSLTAPEFKMLICLCFAADDEGQVELVPAQWAPSIGYKSSAAKALISSLHR